MERLSTVPLVGIGGYSGSGKTTAILELLRSTRLRQYRIGVLKHAHHPLRPGDDTDSARFLAAGARAVVLETTPHAFEHATEASTALRAALRDLPADLDLILVEGFKRAPIPMLWLDTTDPPIETRADLIPRDPAQSLAPQLVQWLHGQRPLRGGILVGGQSTRMGLPKADLVVEGQPLAGWLAHMLTTIGADPALIGVSDVQVNQSKLDFIQDIPGVAGPLAGIAAAQESDPYAAWLILACDFPCLTPAALHWLLAQRSPTADALCPVLRGQPIPVASIWEPTMRRVVEAAIGQGETSPLRILIRNPTTRWVSIPLEYEPAFASANTPAEWEALTGAPPQVWTPAD